MAETEGTKKQRQIANEWRAFSKTLAYKELRDYIDMQNEFAIAGAKGPVMPFGGEDGEQLIIEPIKTALLLQRSVGYDIVTTYVDGYLEYSENVEQLKITT